MTKYQMYNVYYQDYRRGSMTGEYSSVTGDTKMYVLKVLLLPVP